MTGQRGVWRVWLLAVALLASACVPKKPGGIEAMVKSFEQQTGVDLHLVGVKGEPAPDVAKRVELGPVDPKLVRTQLPYIQDVLMAYPPVVRQEMVGNIYLVGVLRIDDRPFLGLAHPKQGRFELAVRPGTRSLNLQGTMHHEIGHLFEAEDPFKASGWKAISRDMYVGARPDAKWSEKGAWLEEGFITAYASKNPAEDFAELAELAWMRPDRARQAANRYPKLETKLELMTEVYQQTAPGIEMPWTGAAWERWRAERVDARRRKQRGEAPKQS